MTKKEYFLMQISPIYEQSAIMDAIYEAIGHEWELLEEQIAYVRAQLFPQTADGWGLSLWEKRLGLVTNLNEDLEIRRNKVIVKLSSRYPMTPERMAFIIKKFTGLDSIIDENVSPYIFRVEIKEGNFDLTKCVKIINKIKPSHCGYEFSILCEHELQLNTEYKEYEQDYLMAGTFECGTEPENEVEVYTYDSVIENDTTDSDYENEYLMSGTFESGGADN